MARYVNLEVTDTKTVKLRMNVADVINLEKALGGKSPLSIFNTMSGSGNIGDLPTMHDVLLLLHYSLQGMEHGYDVKKSEALFNEYLNFEGEDAETGEEINRSYLDLLPVLIEVFQVSGIIPKSKSTIDPNEVADEVNDPNV